MAEAVTPETVMAWFREYQKNCVVKNGVVPEWFHGIISRKQSEEMLMTKPLGCFLIRVSESRLGYTLSYKAEDQCRHFMIDMLQNNQYVIVGEMTIHHTLQDLVDFHRKTPITSYTELLTIACGQISEDNTNYARLIHPMNPTGTDVWSNRSSAQVNAPEDLPPALPARPNTLLPTTPTQSPSTSLAPAMSPSCPRLYPSLALELNALKPHHVESSPPIPTPRTKLINTAPLTSIRNVLNQVITGEDKWKGLTTRCSEGLQPSSDQAPEEKVHQNTPAESKHPRMGLAMGKKMFWKKKDHSKQHIYTSINKDDVGQNSVTVEMRDEQQISGFKQDPETKPGTLPAEYLNPPPFAPGF